MAEAVASHTHPMRACAADEAARRRQQAEDVAELVERMIERMNRLERELRDVTADRDRLREENKRLKGE